MELKACKCWSNSKHINSNDPIWKPRVNYIQRITKDKITLYSFECSICGTESPQCFTENDAMIAWNKEN